MPLPPIIFEDETLVAFDKPSGMLVAPDRWDKTRENLMGLVHAHPKYGHSVANVHRLDADTSGLLLCAKTKPALDFLTGQFQSKTVQKKYHAVVAVLPPEHAMKVVAPIREELQRRRDAAVSALRAAGFALESPKAAMYLWVALPAGVQSAGFARQTLEDTGALVLPGSAFGPAGEGYFRIALTVGPDRLKEAAARLGRSLQAIRRGELATTA